MSRSIVPLLPGLLAAALALLAGCNRREKPAPSEPSKTVEPPKAAASKPAADQARVHPVQPKATEETSVEVEALTGAHTRIVWSQYQKKKSADPYSSNDDHFLMGLDTRDGLGIRVILSEKGNYTRPLLSADGQTVLYTVKGLTRDGKGNKHYKPVIMRTDWLGREPAQIAEGYAVDAWLDTASGTEWVYAVREITPSPRIAIEARKMIRFPLTDPAKEELVWDQTFVSPDNIQFSRDGRRASGQFPWPNAGQFVAGEGGKPTEFKKLLTGCWPGLAPDNSYVSWILDGEHKQATFFSGDGASSWNLKFNAHPDLEMGEIYHPRWTSHPRFITLTGPYLGELVPGEGSVIGKGGLTAEIYIGKLGEKLDRFEEWVRVTDNELGDNYPDVWIEGGDRVDLAGFPQAKDASATAGLGWPRNRDGLVFLWEDRNKNNTVKLRDGHQLDCSLETKGAARYGRHFEMLLDTGSFAPKAEAAAAIADAFKKDGPVSVELVLGMMNPEGAGEGAVATFPGLQITCRGGLIHAKTDSGIIGLGPLSSPVVHFAAVRSGTGYALRAQGADGKTHRAFTAKAAAAARDAPIVFGGGGAGAGLLRVAIYKRPLDEPELVVSAGDLPADLVSVSAARVKLRGRLLEASPMPTAEGINPYTSALVECVYEVTNVIEGDYNEKRVFVKHWGMLDRKTTAGFPRRPGVEYELLLEPLSEHPQLKGDRSMALDVFDLDPYYDVSAPKVP